MEGHELEAIKSCENIIESNKPLIVFGLLKHSINSGKSDVVDLLESLGYEEYFELYKFDFLGVRKRRLINFQRKTTR